MSRSGYETMTQGTWLTQDVGRDRCGSERVRRLIHQSRTRAAATPGRAGARPAGTKTMAPGGQCCPRCGGRDSPLTVGKGQKRMASSMPNSCVTGHGSHLRLARYTTREAAGKAIVKLTESELQRLAQRLKGTSDRTGRTSERWEGSIGY